MVITSSLDFDVSVHFGFLKNLDLLQKGVYSIRASLSYGPNKVLIMPISLFSSPHSLSSSVNNGDIIIPPVRMISCTELIENDRVYRSRSLLIRYCNEVFEINDGVHWRLTLPDFSPHLLFSDGHGGNVTELSQTNNFIKKTFPSNISNSTPYTTSSLSLSDPTSISYSPLHSLLPSEGGLNLLYLTVELLYCPLLQIESENVEDQLPKDEPNFKVVSTQVLGINNFHYGLHQLYSLTFDNLHSVNLDCFIHIACSNIKYKKISPYYLTRIKDWLRQMKNIENINNTQTNTSNNSNSNLSIENDMDNEKKDDSEENEEDKRSHISSSDYSLSSLSSTSNSADNEDHSSLSTNSPTSPTLSNDISECSVEYSANLPLPPQNNLPTLDPPKIPLVNPNEIVSSTSYVSRSRMTTKIDDTVLAPTQNSSSGFSILKVFNKDKKSKQLTGTISSSISPNSTSINITNTTDESPITNTNSSSSIFSFKTVKYITNNIAKNFTPSSTSSTISASISATSSNNNVSKFEIVSSSSYSSIQLSPPVTYEDLALLYDCYALPLINNFCNVYENTDELIICGSSSTKEEETIAYKNTLKEEIEIDKLNKDFSSIDFIINSENNLKLNKSKSKFYKLCPLINQKNLFFKKLLLLELNLIPPLPNSPSLISSTGSNLLSNFLFLFENLLNFTNNLLKNRFLLFFNNLKNLLINKNIKILLKYRRNYYKELEVFYKLHHMISSINYSDSTSLTCMQDSEHTQEIYRQIIYECNQDDYIINVYNKLHHNLDKFHHKNKKKREKISPISSVATNPSFSITTSNKNSFSLLLPLARHLKVFDWNIYSKPSRLPYLFIEQYINDENKSKKNIDIDNKHSQILEFDEDMDSSAKYSSPKDSSPKHLVVLQHGFLGCRHDMRLLAQALAQLSDCLSCSSPTSSAYKEALANSSIKTGEWYENILLLKATSNEGQFLDSIIDMGKKLAQEIFFFCQDKIPDLLDPSKDKSSCTISFIGHSLGGLIIRAALSDDLLKNLKNKCNVYISLSTPHVGNLFGESNLVNTGMWAMKKIKNCLALKELVLEDIYPTSIASASSSASSASASTYDSQDFPEIPSSILTNFPLFTSTTLFKIATNKSLNNFSHIFLFSSLRDQYVPFYSSRLQVSQRIINDLKLGPCVQYLLTCSLNNISSDKIKRINIINPTDNDIKLLENIISSNAYNKLSLPNDDTDDENNKSSKSTNSRKKKSSSSNSKDNTTAVASLSSSSTSSVSLMLEGGVNSVIGRDAHISYLENPKLTFQLMQYVHEYILPATNL